MTKSGIERDLSKTPYVTTINYGNNCISYCFSSKTAQAKFETELEDNREEIKSSLLNRFRIKFVLSNDFCDLMLYKRLERRGFLVVMNGDNVTWLGNLEYNGTKVIVKN